MVEPLRILFRRRFGAEPEGVLRLRPDGSSREYYRITAPGGETAIGVFGPDPEENRAFFAFTRAFRDAGLPVPDLYEVGEDGWYIEEDLGNRTLFEALSEARDRAGGRFPEEILPQYRRVVDVLPRFQVEGGRVADFSYAYPRAAFDRQSILWDLNYFKYHFLKLAHIPFNEARLEEDFRRLAAFLLRADTRHFLYRDFQSRNIMLRDGEPWFVDYQGGRQGALQYDIASLLYDGKAAIPDTVREELFERYLETLQRRVTVDGDLFRIHYRGYVLVRIMQALGTYGYRGFYERKRHFLQSVPYAMRNIETLLETGLVPVRVPELERVFRRMIESPRLRGESEQQPPGLVVRVGSFSYRRGLPEDETGHGGGFVFDCRALPNPGREQEFADLCGLDPPVSCYLDALPETDAFWEGARAMVERQVETYLDRDFNSLSVHFGCTGGQHRSVYLAERLAAHLRERFPDVHVRLTHREQQTWPSNRALARSGV